MKTPAFVSLALAAVLPASATVSIEFQLGGIEVPAGSIGVLVADTGDDGFDDPSSDPGAILSVGETIGDDVVVAVLAQSSLPVWGTGKGFADQLAVLDYAKLGVAEGQELVLHVFPDRSEGDSVRPGEPHLSYRSDDLGDRSSNSTMGFALPRDGGAHLLAVLGPGQGGGADLADVNLTEVPYASGSGGFNRSLPSTASHHYYYFHLAAPGFLHLQGAGASGLQVDLYGPGGQLIASSTGGNFQFLEPLGAGFHRLEFSGAAGGYSLLFANADGRPVTPDVAVGPTLARLAGRNVPGGTANLTSKQAKRVTGYAAVSNRGSRPNAIAVKGARKTALMGVAYFDASGNVTSRLVSGAYRTPVLEATKPASAIRVQFTPNKKKLVKKSGRKTVVRKITFNAAIRASSTATASNDTGTLRVRTR